MLYQSAYNHIVKVNINKKEQYILMNLFTGGSICTDAAHSDIFREKIINEEKLKYDFASYLLDKSYIYKDVDEEQRYINELFAKDADRDEISARLNGGYYGFITSLYCNLKCPYCFQQRQADSIGFFDQGCIDAALRAIEICESKVKSRFGLSETRPKISITGGEPLLESNQNIKSLKYLLSNLSKLNYPYSITTNGTLLFSFAQEYKNICNCRNVQVTIDGPETVHNSRRAYRNGAGSFGDICKGIDFCLNEGWKITLRVNLDITNISNLAELARFIDMRWMKYENFYAYVSPITDHGNLGTYEKPIDEADLLLRLLTEINKHPIIRKVFDIKHFRGFSYVEQIILKKSPRYPVVFRCEAISGMYIFAPDNKIYVCLESVGELGMEVGRYFPKLEICDSSLKKWSMRNALNIDRCRECKIRFICAGGCTIESFKKADTDVCMPFLKEIDIAWDYYAENRPDLFL